MVFKAALVADLESRRLLSALKERYYRGQLFSGNTRQALADMRPSREEGRA